MRPDIFFCLLHATFFVFFSTPARTGIISSDFQRFGLLFGMPLFAVGVNTFEFNMTLEEYFVDIRDLIFQDRFGLSPSILPFGKACVRRLLQQWGYA
jgi:hypothetical protein